MDNVNIAINTKMVKIYLDNAATTKVDKKVVSAMLPYFNEKYANASSSHEFGKEIKKYLEAARETIASSINARPEEIIFTSGGTESNNLVLLGLSAQYPEKNHIIVSKIEHDSILSVCKLLEKKGLRITYLDVDSEGFVNLDQLEKEITPKTLLVSIIHANNEIGVIQDLEKIGKICNSKEVYFHTDACQSYTKVEIDVEKQNLDFVTLNGHKIHGPKGIGALFIRKAAKLTPQIIGGGHENGIRSGTENIPAIIGFACAVKLASSKNIKDMLKLRDYTIKQILEISDTKLNGSLDKRLCNNINISFANIEGEAISQHLENKGIFISTGSACASHTLKKSHVLKAIGRSDLEINSSIRISLSKYNTKKEIDYFIKNLKPIVIKLRKMSPFA